MFTSYHYQTERGKNHIAAILSLYIREEYYFNKSCMFSTIYYHSSFQDSKVSGATVAAAWRFSASAML